MSWQMSLIYQDHSPVGKPSSATFCDAKPATLNDTNASCSLRRHTKACVIQLHGAPVEPSIGSRCSDRRAEIELKVCLAQPRGSANDSRWLPRARLHFHLCCRSPSHVHQEHTFTFTNVIKMAAQKEATVYIVDVGRTMGERSHGRVQTNLDFAMEYVWDKITTTVATNRKTAMAGAHESTHIENRWKVTNDW